MNVMHRLLATGVVATLMMFPAALAQQSSHHGAGSLAHHVSGRSLGGGISSGGIGSRGIGIGGGVGGWGFGGWGLAGWGYGAWLPYYAVGFPGGVFTFVPPMLPIGPGGFAPMMGPQPLAVGRGPIAPPPPPGLMDPANQGLPVNKAGEKTRTRGRYEGGPARAHGRPFIPGQQCQESRRALLSGDAAGPKLGRTLGRPGTDCPGPRAV